MIPDQFLQELKYRSDIEQIIGSYVNLRRRGRTLSGLCPFHSEKSPSFTVYPENQSFYCFGCGAGGDVISFIRRIENLDYMESIRFLAQRAGMQVPEEAGDDRSARLRKRILELNRDAARYFHRNLMSEAGRPGRAYLIGRGLTKALYLCSPGFSLSKRLRMKSLPLPQLCGGGGKEVDTVWISYLKP